MANKNKKKTKVDSSGRIKTKVRFGGLFKTIFLTAILCMLIPVLVVSLVSTMSVYSDLRETSDTHLAQLATEKTNQLNAVIDNQLQLVKSVANSPDVVNTVTEKLANKDKSPDSVIMDYLVGIFENGNGMFENFFLSAGNMGIASGLGGADLHDITGEGSYETGMDLPIIFFNLSNLSSARLSSFKSSSL